MNRLLFAATLLLNTALLRAEAPVWPHAGSDLKPDARLVMGQLESGVRYVIMPNQEPPGRVSIRLYMDVGSLMEDDDQQGMAHFLEHMAFNGSKNFPAGQLVEYFQRLGMAFGADTNAHTSFLETVYQLELPKVEEKLMDDGIKLFRDYLDGMELGEKEIDRERGIILSEKLARDSVEWRTMLAGFTFAMPEAKISRRMPIGIDETLKTMGRPRFVDFYESWYTPKRAIVVVVGDVKAEMVKKHLEKHFAGAKAKRGEKPNPDFGKVSGGRGLVAKLHTEMESAATDISLEITRPSKGKPDSAARRRELMVRDLGDFMLNNRLQELTKVEKPVILGGESYSYDYLDFVDINGLQVKCKPELWKEALSLAEQELRRAIEHGFTEAEFEEAKAGILKMARMRAEQAPTRKSRDLASQIVSTLAAKRVFTDPVDDLKRVEEALAGITRQEALGSFRAGWDSQDINLFVGGNLKLEGDPAGQLMEIYKASQQKPVTAPEEKKAAQFAYTDFGPAGKVAKREEVKDLEVTLVKFDNNVRLNVKKTPFENGAVRVVVSFGGGALEIPADKPGLALFAEGAGMDPHGGGGSTFVAGGLEKHSADELRQILASKQVGVDFAVGSDRMGNDAFLLSGKTTPGDLETQLQLLTAYMVAPGYREEAERQFRQGLDPLYQAVQHTDGGIMGSEVESFIHSGDPRFGIPKREDLEKRNTAEMKAWLEKPLKDSYVEVAIVGDVEVDQAIELVGRTLGALPKRAETKPAYVAERAVKFPAEPKRKDFKFKTEIPRAVALAYWPTTDMSNIQKTRRLSLLGAVLDDRMRVKIREEMGDSYSPMAHHLPSDTFTGYGYMFAYITLKPEQAEKVGRIVSELGEGLAKEGSITADEFERARKPQLSQIEQMRRDNGYWLGRVLRNCQEQPQRLDWARSMLDDIKSIKKEDLEALAKEYLGAGKATVIGVLPE